MYSIQYFTLCFVYYRYFLNTTGPISQYMAGGSFTCGTKQLDLYWALGFRSTVLQKHIWHIFQTHTIWVTESDPIARTPKQSFDQLGLTACSGLFPSSQILLLQACHSSLGCQQYCWQRLGTQEVGDHAGAQLRTALASSSLLHEYTGILKWRTR